MELLRFINGSLIEDIPLSYLLQELKSTQHLIKTNVLNIKYNNRLKNIKCIREYYIDPSTNKKMPRVSMVNPCQKIHGVFNINRCVSLDCNNCHQIMIEKYYNNESFLIKNTKK